MTILNPRVPLHLNKTPELSHLLLVTAQQIGDVGETTVLGSSLPSAAAFVKGWQRVLPRWLYGVFKIIPTPPKHGITGNTTAILQQQHCVDKSHPQLQDSERCHLSADSGCYHTDLPSIPAPGNAESELMKRT